MMKKIQFFDKKNIISEKLRLLRVKNQMTQQDLAAKMQLAGIIIERDSVSRIEIGTRFVPDYELRELAKILKVTVDWLLDDSNKY